MLSKIQFYLLIGSFLIGTGICALWQFWQTAPVQRFPVSATQAVSDTDQAQDHTSDEQAGDETPEPASEPDSSPMAAQGETADDIVIDAIMEKLESSFKAGDYSYSIEMMYGPLVAAAGGKEKLLEGARALMAQTNQQLVVITSWKARKPYRYINIPGNSRKWVIIPYEARTTTAGRKLKQTGYQLGIKSTGSPWQFINGDKLSPELFEEYFPDFPKNLELPEVHQEYE